MIFKANCKCEQLYLSETYGGYDTVCNLDGKLCPCITWDSENEEYIITDESKCHSGQIQAGLSIIPELQAKIDKARQEDKEGKTITCRTSEELDAFLDTL